MQIFDEHQLQLHPLALARASSCRWSSSSPASALMVDARACRSASTSPAARCSSSQFEQAGQRGAGARRRRRRCPATRSCSSYGDAGRAPGPDPPAAGRGRRSRATSLEQGARQVERRAAEGRACRSSRSSAARSSARSIGADLQRRGIYATLASTAGDHRLHRLPLPVLVRRRRHRRDAARRPGDAGVPGVLRLRPVAQRRRGAS